jgi:hypothetical protein
VRRGKEGGNGSGRKQMRLLIPNPKIQKRVEAEKLRVGEE